VNTNQYDIYSGSALTVTYILPATGNVKLFIFNIRGNVVRHLYEGTESMGRHTQTWHGLDEQGQKINSGLYLLVLRYNGETIIRKFVAIRH
jgi:flagellar hook assembly protein FlgD